MTDDTSRRDAHRASWPARQVTDPSLVASTQLDDKDDTGRFGPRGGTEDPEVRREEWRMKGIVRSASGGVPTLTAAEQAAYSAACAAYKAALDEGKSEEVATTEAEAAGDAAAEAEEAA
jgi:hypothetical protein